MGIRRIGVEESLRRLGVNATALDAVRAVANKHDIPLREAVFRVDGVDPAKIAEVLSQLSGLPVMPTVDFESIEAELVLPLPLNVARDKGVLPLYRVDRQVVVAIADLSSMTALDDLRVLLGSPIRPVLMPADVLKSLMDKTYEKAKSSMTASSVLEDAEDNDEENVSETDLMIEDADILDDSSDAVIIRFVNALLAQAVREGASDIHIEPFEKDLSVRFRIDGVLYNKVSPPYRLRNSISARIKIMAGLNIAEKRLPQDGRIRKRMAGREIDLRVSTLPVRHGERVVMRILEKGEVFSLDKIGMPPSILANWRKLIRKPHGILLVSGPTGSGKTSTLFSALSEINSPELNILTIEDPIEYEIKGIGQTQVNSKIDLTFASALRAHLRQDPDVILVGEIRDSETANNAVQASLTGHMVFSTIHTNDAAGAFPRMVDMGVEPFLVASSLLGVLAQRLIRRLCEPCKESYVPSDDELADVGLTRGDLRGNGKAWRAVGCAACNQTGYKNRTGIYEFLPATEEVKALLMRNADAGSIKKAAITGGMRTLRDDGVAKVLAGLTTFDEVLRVTREDEMDD